MLQKVRDYLKQELNDVIQVEENSQDDYIVMGRKEFAEGLLSQMQKWEAEEEKGTVYTGDAPSTEASFYKKSQVEDLDNQSYSEGEEYDNE